jgi:hypothetical protein
VVRTRVHARPPGGSAAALATRESIKRALILYARVFVPDLGVSHAFAPDDPSLRAGLDWLREKGRVTSAEILENLLRLKIGALARPAFSIRTNEIAPMQAELTTPGCELADLYHARRAFGR